MTDVQSVTRSIELLRCLSGGPARVGDLAERTGLPKSTVSRLLATLAHHHAVEATPISGEYRLGKLIKELASVGALPAGLAEVARPHLAELVAATGEAVGLSVLDGDTARYIAQHAADTAVQVRDWTGERIPAHATSSGLVLLAMTGRVPAGPLQRFTARTVTDPARVARRLAGIRTRGVVWTVGEYLADLSSVAAPIRDRSGAVVAALHVHGPTYRFPGATEAAIVEQRLIATAGRIGRGLAGGSGSPTVPIDDDRSTIRDVSG